jgi:hypothetical protein
MNLITIIVGLSLAFHAQASTGKDSRKEQARKIARETELSRQLSASEVYQKLINGSRYTSPLPPCQPTGPSCVDAACSHMPKWNCDDLSEIKEVGRACSGNFDGGCIDLACSKMPRYNCDDLDEISDIAKACSGLYNSQCISDICSRMPSFNCDDKNEIIDVINACKGL